MRAERAPGGRWSGRGGEGLHASEPERVENRVDQRGHDAPKEAQRLAERLRRLDAVLAELDSERCARVEAERQAEEARQALELQERLVSVVGHDLRTPLSAIRMAVELLQRRGDLSLDQARTLGRLRGSAARMTALVRDLLDYARIRREGGMPVRPEDVNLAELARRVVLELASAHPDRVIVLDAPLALPVRGDPERLCQALSNLVANALQHGPREEAAVVRLEPVPGGVALEVQNRGPPIPAELLPELFEPYRRGGGGEGDAGGSLGLGLFVVREVVRAHGGTVQVRSTLEEGTTFTVSLPAAAGVSLH
jgi:signal transduction histidine kinase